MNRPSQIQAEHLTKAAVVYVRLSSPEHRLWDTSESTSELVERATLWGWPNSHIQVLYDDVGTSVSRPRQCQGFRQMLTKLEGGEVAIVFATDISRLFRNARDAEDLLRIAAARNVLLAVDGQLFSPYEPSDRLLIFLQFLYGRSENEARRAWVYWGSFGFNDTAPLN